MENSEKSNARSIQHEMQKLQLVTMPGYTALGLGLYGKFAARGNAFHPLLNNEKIQWVLLAFGILTVFWGGYSVMKITRGNRLQKDTN